MLKASKHHVTGKANWPAVCTAKQDPQQVFPKDPQNSVKSWKTPFRVSHIHKKKSTREIPIHPAHDF